MGRVRKAQARLSAAQIGRELHLSDRRVRKLLRTYAWLADPQGTPPTYDPRFVHRYRAMHGIGIIEPVHRDWLARYLKGTQ